MSEEQEQEIKKITKLFHELPSISIEDAKQCTIRCVKLQIEVLEKINKEKYIVHWGQERFNNLLQSKYQLLTELKTI